MPEVGTAYVRLRPSFSGFKSETEAGVRSGLGGLAKIIGVAFGAKEAFDFGKNIVTGAADLQKQVEGIHESFGAVGDDLIAFGKTAAGEFGVSADLADTTSARFGLLFKNLGIGPGLAAKMTKGFEQLGGAVATIRNIDPSQIFANLPLAAAGNIRSLKSLGLAIDSNTIKLAAIKLGFIQATNEAITPGQRAIAIYALAAGRLPQVLEQAKLHSGDLADQTAKLKAEWSNAKDELGAGLLPIMTRLVTYLADNLPGAVDSTKAAFSGLKDLAEPFVNIGKKAVDSVGGIKDAVIGLLIALSIAKVAAFVHGTITLFASVGKAIVGQAAIAIGATQAEAAAYVTATTTMEAATIGLAATIKTALISTGIGALVVAIGLAAAYVITHWEKVKGWFVGFGNFLPTLFHSTWLAVQGITEIAIADMLVGIYFLAKGLGGALGWIPGIGPKIKAGLSVITDGIDALRTDGIEKVRTAGTDLAAGFMDAFKTQTATDLKQVAKAFDEWGKGTKESRKNALGDLAKQGFTTDLLTGKTIDTKGNVKDIKDATDKQAELLTTLQGQYDTTIKASATGIQKIRNQIKQLGLNLAQAVKDETNDVRQAVQDAKTNLASIGSSLAATIGSVLDKPLQDAQNKATAAANQLSLNNLRQSVLLPGGKQLSTNPDVALAQLRNLAAHAGNINKAAIQNFILQYQQAVLTVKQDQVNIVKEHASRTIADLTADFGSGKITAAQFKAGILAEMKRDHVSYKLAGKVLGTAFAQGFRGQVKDLFAQAAALASASAAGIDVKGVSATDTKIVKPLETFNKDQAKIVRIQGQIRDKHGALLTKIATSTAKAAALQERINKVRLGDVSTSNAKAPGKGAENMKLLQGTAN